MVLEMNVGGTESLITDKAKEGDETVVISEISETVLESKSCNQVNVNKP